MLAERQAAQRTFDAAKNEGLTDTQARWAVLDSVTVLLSVAKCSWIRSSAMAEAATCNLTDDLFEIRWGPLDPRIIAWVYSDLMNANLKTKTAAIYTPESITKYMVSSSLYLGIKQSCSIDVSDGMPDNTSQLLSVRRALSGLKIVDPCCGAGLFLYEAWMQMAEMEDRINQELGCRPEKRYISLNQLHGVDINPEAIEVSKRLLQFAFNETRLRRITA